METDTQNVSKEPMEGENPAPKLEQTHEPTDTVPETQEQAPLMSTREDDAPAPDLGLLMCTPPNVQASRGTHPAPGLTTIQRGLTPLLRLGDQAQAQQRPVAAAIPLEGPSANLPPFPKFSPSPSRPSSECGDQKEAHADAGSISSIEEPLWASEIQALRREQQEAAAEIKLAANAQAAEIKLVANAQAASQAKLEAAADQQMSRLDNMLQLMQ